MSARAPTATEREEIGQLLYELELADGAALRAYALELLRLRAVIECCRRNRRALPARVQRVLDEKCPPRPSFEAWRSLSRQREDDPGADASGDVLSRRLR